MKVKVYFGETPDNISTVGMNNLIIFKDNRVRTAKGLAKSLSETIGLYRMELANNRHFLILDWDTDEVLGGGYTSKGDESTSKLYYELTKKPFSFIKLKYNNKEAVHHIEPLGYDVCNSFHPIGEGIRHQV